MASVLPAITDGRTSEDVIPLSTIDGNSQELTAMPVEKFHGARPSATGDGLRSSEQKRGSLTETVQWGATAIQSMLLHLTGDDVDSQEEMHGQWSHQPRKSILDKSKERAVFLDTDAMKEKVRMNLMRPKHHVTNYYKLTGMWQAIARSAIFENITLVVIACNAVWIAIDTDRNHVDLITDADLEFQIAENFFCSFFTLEWFIRFMSFREKKDGLKDGWFVFDSFLVLLMILETWVFSLVVVVTAERGAGAGKLTVLRIARLLRLSRMARVARLLRSMPELMIMIKGMVAAARSVFFTLLLLVTIMYVFGIAFTQLARDSAIAEPHFSSVGHSMYTLMLFGALLDEVGYLSDQMNNDTLWHLLPFLFIFILLAALTVLNMLIGVLCEVVSAVAATEKEEMLVNYVNVKLKSVVAMIDENGDDMISKKEFLRVLENAEAVRALKDVGVDVVNLIDFADYIFEADDDFDVDMDQDLDDECKQLDFGRFMEVVLQLRGTNTATVKDVVDLRKFMRSGMGATNAQLAFIQDQLNSILTATAPPVKPIRRTTVNSRRTSSALKSQGSFGGAGDTPQLSISQDGNANPSRLLTRGIMRCSTVQESPSGMQESAAANNEVGPRRTQSTRSVQLNVRPMLSRSSDTSGASDTSSPTPSLKIFQVSPKSSDDDQARPVSLFSHKHKDRESQSSSAKPKDRDSQSSVLPMANSPVELQKEGPEVGEASPRNTGEALLRDGCSMKMLSDLDQWSLRLKEVLKAREDELKRILDKPPWATHGPPIAGFALEKQKAPTKAVDTASAPSSPPSAPASPPEAVDTPSAPSSPPSAPASPLASFPEAISPPPKAELPEHEPLSSPPLMVGPGGTDSEGGHGSKAEGAVVSPPGIPEFDELQAEDLAALIMSEGNTNDPCESKDSSPNADTHSRNRADTWSEDWDFQVGAVNSGSSGDHLSPGGQSAEG